MELETQQTILTEIIKGEHGKVLKADLTEEKIAELEALTGELLDCRFDFTRIQKSFDEHGEEMEEEIIEDMYCGALIETEDAFIIERDMLANYEPGDDLTALEAKTKITL